MNTTPAIVQRLAERSLLQVRNGVINLEDAKRALRNNAVVGAIAGIRRELVAEQTAKRQEVQRRQGNSTQARAEQAMYTAAESRGRLSVQLEMKREQEQRLQEQVAELQLELAELETQYDELCETQHNIN